MNFKFSILLLAISSFLSACHTDKSPKEICGCTDQMAANFNEKANCNNNSCFYIDDEKKTLNTFFTSTGCGACGIYGIDCHTQYSNNMLQKAIPFELHFKYGDSMINATNDSFVQIVKPRYSPFFAVGLTESMVVGKDRPETCELSAKNADELINAFLVENVHSKIGVSHHIKNDSLFVDFGIEAPDFEKLRYAIFILEDSLVYTQNAGWKNDIAGWVHNNVVRDALTPVIGISIKKAEVVNQISKPMANNWKKDNIYAVLVVWKLENGFLRVVNAESSKL